MTPQVSVITATYNDGYFLAEAIESILNQTFNELEYIIIDDASDDGITPGIIANYAASDKRIIPRRNEHNQGRSASRNKALAAAKGELIAIMDGDDISTLDRLERQVEFLNNHPTVGYLGSKGKYVSRNGQKTLKVFEPPMSHAEITWTLMFTFPFLHSSTMGYRKLFTEAGKYDPSFTRAEDMDLWRRMMPLTEFANLPDILYYYRAGERRPASYYQQTVVFPLKVHRELINDVLDEPIDDDVFYVLMQPDYYNRVDLPAVSPALIRESISTLCKLSERFLRFCSPSERALNYISQDVCRRIFQTLFFYPDQINDIINQTLDPRMRELVNQNLSRYHWKQSAPSLWKIPYYFFHPKAFLRRIKHH